MFILLTNQYLQCHETFQTSVYLCVCLFVITNRKFTGAAPNDCADQ